MLGQLIHGYHVDRVLSADKGGFGEVFLATHVDSGAEAVVKVLRAELSAHRDTVARFFNEARAAASIHHPGIVQIHNVGYQGDRAYLLMERLRGDDLETRVKSGPLPIDRALMFMRQTAGAIGAAHERGIVHRDLKPANLFVVADPDVAGGERIKVLDFGIAKLSFDAGAGTGKTQGVFGTPAYMSPEQCASTGAVDQRADLYSLGCILYELVTGQPPFGRGGIELIAAHLRDVPQPPRAIAPWVPLAVEAVILQLLEKEPQRRLQSCAALTAAIDGAAVASGIALGTAPSIANPVGGSFPSPTTLGASTTEIRNAPTRTIERPKKRSFGLAVAVGAIVAAIGIVVAVIATGGSRSKDIATPAPSVVLTDAAVAAVAPTPPTSAPAERPKDPRAQELVEEGKAALVAGNAQEAVQKFRQVIVIEPWAGAYLDLGIAEYQTGDFGNALMALDAVSRNDPTPKELQNAQVVIGKLKAEMRAQGIKPPPDANTPPPPPSVDATASAAGADALLLQGKDAAFANHYAEAAKLFRQSIALVPNPQAYFDLGIAEYQSGNFEASLRALDDARAHHPDARLTKLIDKTTANVRADMRKQGITPPP